MKVSRVATFAACAVPLVAAASFTYDAVQRDGVDVAAPPGRYGSPGSGVAPEFDRQSFWFARGFDVGDSKNLEFLIDTGSSDILLGSGYYNASKSADNLHKNFTITYYSANKNGGGTQTIKGKLFKDVVSFAGLSFPTQEIGVIPQKAKGPQGGIIGFSGPASSSFNGTPWFNNLCNKKIIDECRFGLAYGINKTGKQVIGKLDTTLFEGSLVTAPRLLAPMDHWSVRGDVTVGGVIIEKNALLLTDSGTTVIEAPLHSAKTLFKHLGFQTVFHPGNASEPLLRPSYLYGYFPCDKPPTVGFSIPAASSGKKGTNFNLEPSVWSVKDNGNNNCTAVILGTDQFSQGLGFGRNGWLVGQAFHQGHYIDHDKASQTMGFAVLKNPENP